jgi:hypothetical protein
VIATELLEECDRLGITLEVDGAQLRWQADNDPPLELLARLREHKPAILAALQARRCPKCGRLMDAKRRCWAKACFDRLCECGRLTGSAYIATCFVCSAQSAASAMPRAN